MAKREDGHGAYSSELPAITVLIAILLAFGFRVIPAYQAVFTARGVSFQEPDAWFHMRGIHNLMAHFPRHSGFDPYSLYPGGQNIVTGPFWDYVVGSTAWIAGAGSPSDNLVDEVGAWLPAILGALLPLPVFLLARRLSGVGTGMWSALWAAIIPGAFLWVGHLGLADHHAAEVFASLLVLVFLSSAAESQGRRRWSAAALAGVALAAYLNIQVTGIQVPAILAVAAIVSPALAQLCTVTLAAACLLLLPLGAESPWLEYRWLALLGSLAVTAPVAVLNVAGVRRQWSSRTRYGATAVVALVTLGCLELSEAAKIQTLVKVVRSYGSDAPGPGVTFNVNELTPLLSAPPGGVGSLFNEFGAAWIFALPGLASLLVMAWRVRRPAVMLFAVWSCTMIFGAFIHLRMAAYAGIAVAILAGHTTAWIVDRIPSRTAGLRALTTGVIALAAVSLSLPPGWAETSSGAGPDPDWWSAMTWMRWRTPEPMGDPLTWYRWFPRLKPEASFAYPNSAYGVIALWDKGWWISGIARRIPAANGGESGAAATSRFLTETNPADALRDMREIGARYAAIGPGSVTFDFPGMVAMAERRFTQYSRIFYAPRPGASSVPIRVYLPAFYRSMSARLYLFDGRRIQTKTQGVQVFLTTSVPTKSGAYEETIQHVRKFASETEAEQWLALHPNETANLASADATVSCADLEEIPWLKRVFVSRNETLAAGNQPAAVKIFELMPSR